LLVRDERILATGYNGAPSRAAHCIEVGCLMVNGHCLRATHAEANAITQGARHGVSLTGSTAYVTHEPCLGCSKLLVSVGVIRVVYRNAYPDPLAAALLAEVGITPVHIPPRDVPIVIETPAAES
jgi:dCMP deaminase